MTDTKYAVEVNHKAGMPELIEGLTKRQAKRLIKDKGLALKVQGYVIRVTDFCGMPEITFANADGDTGYIGAIVPFDWRK